jgi:hypothetical protein
VVLTLTAGGQALPRILLADTGAGSQAARFQLILAEDDCLRCGGSPLPPLILGGAYTGAFPTYSVPVRVPALGFDRDLRAVAVHSLLSGFDGIACFGFLNGFTYGNFGDPKQFGLER